MLMASWLFARAVYYPTLFYNVLMEGPSRRWYDRIDSCVILGALPFKSQTKQLVEEENVRGVVTLNEPYETKYFCNSKEEWQNWGVKQLHLETVDFNNAPSHDMLNKGVDFIDSMKQQGSTVYVHCKAGRGRSATLVGCYLMKNEGFTPEEAFLFIKTRRPHIRLGSRQWDAMRQYHCKLSSADSGNHNCT